MSSNNKKLLFSGAQPTGSLTLGNYLGAVKQWSSLQGDYSSIFCVVDLHAITASFEPKRLSNDIFKTLASYIACGIDHKKSPIFQQSSVPEHLELSWILSCITQLGWLNRMTQFKEKSKDDKEGASLGLYSYPVLMAADILLYHAQCIPVGDDQTQHIELARDIALSFNRRFQVDYFALPEPILSKLTSRIMNLRDGTKKMSKSDLSDFTRINLTDSADLISQKIKKAKTDNVPGVWYDKEGRPEISNLLNIYCLLQGIEIENAVQEFQNCNISTFKEALIEILTSLIVPISQDIERLLNDKQYLLSILKEGQEKVAVIASKTLKEVKQIVGFSL